MESRSPTMAVGRRWGLEDLEVKERRRLAPPSARMMCLAARMEERGDVRMRSERGCGLKIGGWIGRDVMWQ